MTDGIKSERYIAAVLPWNSTDAFSEKTVFCHDSQAQIDRCLSCPFKHCHNCVNYKNTDTLLEFSRLLNVEHKKQTEICFILGISRATFFNYKRKLVSL